MVGAAGVAGGLCWVPTTSITYSSAFENPDYRAANGRAKWPLRGGVFGPVY